MCAKINSFTLYAIWKRIFVLQDSTSGLVPLYRLSNGMLIGQRLTLPHHLLFMFNRDGGIINTDQN